MGYASCAVRMAGRPRTDEVAAVMLARRRKQTGPIAVVSSRAPMPIASTAQPTAAWGPGL